MHPATTNWSNGASPLPPCCRELERQLTALRQQRGEAEAALQRERSQGAGRKTAAELQAMITALQASPGVVLLVAGSHLVCSISMLPLPFSCCCL